VDPNCLGVDFVLDFDYLLSNFLVKVKKILPVLKVARALIVDVFEIVKVRAKDILIE